MGDHGHHLDTTSDGLVDGARRLGIDETLRAFHEVDADGVRACFDGDERVLDARDAAHLDPEEP